MKRNKTVFISLFFVVMILSLAVFYFQKPNYNKSEIEQVGYPKAPTHKIDTNNSGVSSTTQAETSMTTKQNLITETEFLELTNKAMSELPLTKNAQNILQNIHGEADKESHHHSVEYKKMNIAAGEILGNVKQALSDNPNLKPIAIDFYKECTLKKEFFPQVRGLCLYNFKHLVSKEESDSIKVEYAIKAIADKLE